MSEEKIELGKAAHKWTKVVDPYELRFEAVKLHLGKGIRSELALGESSVWVCIEAYRYKSRRISRHKPNVHRLSRSIKMARHIRLIEL